MQLGVLILAAASWRGLGPAEVVGVAGHKGPIASEDDFEQLNLDARRLIQTTCELSPWPRSRAMCANSGLRH